MLVKYSFYFIGMLVMFGACKNNEQQTAILNSVNESLEASTKSIENSNQVIYKEMEERLADPKSVEHTKVWQPKVIAVKRITDSLFSYIDKLKKDKTSQKEVIANNLYKNFKKYKQEILSIDPELNVYFNDSTKRKNLLLDTTINNVESLYEQFFKNVSSISVLTILSKYQNNIRIIENEIITFCYYKTFVLECFRHTKTGIIVAQNTSHLKNGETLEITAGIGEFSVNPQPKIKINNKNIECIDAVAHYKLKVPAKIGKQLIPVSIEYIDQNGEKHAFIKDVEYTVDE